jgi:hypothetical protein
MVTGGEPPVVDHQVDPGGPRHPFSFVSFLLFSVNENP